jgi:hypothetical protein
VKYPTEAAVREFLDPHIKDLTWCVREAYRKWEDHGSLSFQEPLNRARAAYVSCGFYNEAKGLFAERPGVLAIEECERLLLVFGDQFVLRFKLLDADLRTRNYPTEASKRMDAQRQISIPAVGKLPRVILGYRMGGQPETLLDLRVVFAVNNEPLWHYDPENDAQQLALPLEPKKATPPEKRFRRKDSASKAPKKSGEGA